MIEQALHLATLRVEAFSKERVQCLETLAPAPREISMASSWHHADRTATLASLCVAAPLLEELPELHAAHIQSTELPDYFLAGLFEPTKQGQLRLPKEMRHPVDEISAVDAAPLASNLLHLVRLHQIYFGAVSDALATIFIAADRAGGFQTEAFSEEMLKALRDGAPEPRELGYLRSKRVDGPAIAGAMRVMSEFHEMLADEAQTSLRPPFVSELARVRFCRFLTGFEALVELVADSAGKGSVATFRAEHEIGGPTFDSAFGFPTLRPYERVATPRPLFATP